MKRNLVYQVQDSRGRSGALVFETSMTQCPRCGAGMPAYVPASREPLVVGSTASTTLVCSKCNTVIEQARSLVHEPTAPAVGIATAKAIASEVFPDTELDQIDWLAFVPFEMRRADDGAPILVAKGAVIHPSTRLLGWSLIDKNSTVGERSQVGPYTGIIHSKIDADVVLDECRVRHTFVGAKNRLRQYNLDSTVIPPGRFPG